MKVNDLHDYSRPGVSRSAFLYDGTGYTPDDFVRYVHAYDFGTIPPSFIVLHHTYRPGASWASSGAQYDWDGRETGMTDEQIYAKRRQRLDNIRHYYQSQLGWDRGPHLFIDDRWIWVMTPMFHVGIHAAEGNGSVAGGYSVGIEVIGYYEHVQWPASVARNVGIAVAAIKQKLGTFAYEHRRGPGGISSHRDYNKPTCPGAAITENYYLGVLHKGWSDLTSTTPPPAATPKPIVESPLASPIIVHPSLHAAWHASGGVWQEERLTPGHPLGNAREADGVVTQRFERGTARQHHDTPVTWLLLSEQPPDAPMAIIPSPLHDASPIVAHPSVEEAHVSHYLLRHHRSIPREYVHALVAIWYHAAVTVGLDPLVAFAQFFLETGYLTSDWWHAHRNPAGIGVTGAHSVTPKPGYHYHDERQRYEEGLSFASWADAADAHIGRLLAYAMTDAHTNEAQTALIRTALTWRPLPAHLRGAAPTIAGLTGRWAMDPSYHQKLIGVSKLIVEGGLS